MSTFAMQLSEADIDIRNTKKNKYNCETDVNIRNSKVWNGCSHPQHNFLKQMSTFVILEKQKNYETDVDICNTIFWSDVDIRNCHNSIFQGI